MKARRFSPLNPDRHFEMYREQSSFMEQPFPLDMNFDRGVVPARPDTRVRHSVPEAFRRT